MPRRLRDFQMPAHFVEFLAGGELAVALVELAGDLLRRVPAALLRHVVAPLFRVAQRLDLRVSPHGCSSLITPIVPPTRLRATSARRRFLRIAYSFVYGIDRPVPCRWSVHAAAPVTSAAPHTIAQRSVSIAEGRHHLRSDYRHRTRRRTIRRPPSTTRAPPADGRSLILLQ